MSRIAMVATIALGTGAVVLSGTPLASANADADAEATAVGSPGVASGNAIQVPVHAPINACGNTVTVIGALNPAIGNVCKNGHKIHKKSGYGH
ncbi:chaplin [Streptomyces flaveus]|uniref:Membrane protein n=1 Tax=Streptomyces flaveus TaxID=66370 RepID=A0A917V794_9ACTN|nr:chaplin [Streptomyces flaveus]GGK46985.1 membrane protein [Streptomyces flaveus]